MYVFRQYGLYIDGTLGDAYFIRMLKDLLDYARRRSGESLGSLLEDLSHPEEATREPLDKALEYLQAHTKDGLVWVMHSEDGSLLLVPETSVSENPNHDDETKELSWLD